MNKEIIKIPSIEKTNYIIDATRMRSSAYYPVVYMWKSKWDEDVFVQASHITFCGDLATYKSYVVCNRYGKIILESDYV